MKFSLLPDMAKIRNFLLLSLILFIQESSENIFKPSICTNGATTPREIDVLILGAGASGIGAARTIQEQQPDINFLILEASNKPGGRIKNDFMTNVDPNDTERVQISAGAQWLHGRWNPLHNYSLHKGLLVNDNSTEGMGQFIRDDFTVINSTLVREVDEIVEGILLDCQKYYNEPDKYRVYPRSLDLFMNSQFERKLRGKTPQERIMARQLLDWHKRFQAIDYAADDFKKMSAKDWGRMWLIRGRWDHISFRNGFAEVMEMMANDLGSSKIEYNKTVEKIQWGFELNPTGMTDSNKKVLVKCNDGSWYVANHVIVTFSLGVLKQKAEMMFNPKLPPTQSEAISCLGFGPMTKIFLQYKTNFWNEEEGIQFVYRNQNNYKSSSWIRYMTGFDKVMSGTNTFIGWVGQQGTIDMEKLSDKEIVDDLTEFLKTFTRRNVPYPSRYFM